MKYKILCTDGFAESGIAELKKNPDFEVVYKKALSHEELLSIISSFDGLIVRSASKVAKDVIEAGKNLKIVVRAGVGIDNIDLAAAKRREITVVNTPKGNTTSTAELTFAMLLSLARNIPQASCAMLHGIWEKKKFAGNEVANKTLGIIGFGRIGKEVAKRAHAFHMRILGFDPNVSKEEMESVHTAFATLDEIYKNADYITVHTHLSDETKDLISMREIKKMKRCCRIINCARGGIVNEEDLAEALKEGLIAGAALDVYTKEPFDKPVFKDIPNIVLTPHLGASTAEAQDAVAIEAAEVITEFFSEQNS